MNIDTNLTLSDSSHHFNNVFVRNVFVVKYTPRACGTGTDIV